MPILLSAQLHLTHKIIRYFAKWKCYFPWNAIAGIVEVVTSTNRDNTSCHRLNRPNTHLTSSDSEIPTNMPYKLIILS